jgi:cytochrome P450
MATVNNSPVAPPAPLSTSPGRVIVGDVISQFRRRHSFPPGPTRFDLALSRRFTHDPLPILLELYERYGPVFSFRLLHRRSVFMLGPAANHFILVSHPELFHWREGSFGDLTPLLGDGLLTIDEAYHDRARAIMMPAFHREQIEAATAAMAQEAEKAIELLRPGEVIDIYEWMRNLAMRIAMRALLGLDPDDEHHGSAAAYHFERALGFYGTEPQVRLLRGPATPWARMLASRRVLNKIIFEEITRRRAAPDPERLDILSLLLTARDEQGNGLSDEEIHDQLITLMFAGHDTSTSTVSFLLYETARHPDVAVRLRDESDRVLGGRAPSPAELARELPYLEMVVDETLRLYPPAWIGPRRAVSDFEFNGHTVPRDAYVHYCSWASHRLPEVFPDPEAFIPERFTPERKAALPRGAYVPFGGGQRICIGKRFGQTEVKLVSTMLLQRFRLELLPGRSVHVRQMPTLSPDGGLSVRVRERD